MSKVEDNQAQIENWEYCYCKKCDSIKYSNKMEATEKGIKCLDCGSYDLESPAWVRCPNEIRCSVIKCPRGGRGIKVTPEGEKCIFNCTFRTPNS